MAEPPFPEPSQAEDAVFGEAERFVLLLLKGIKNIGIYRHAEERFADYLKPAHDALESILEEQGSLPLKLGPYTLHYKKHVVYEDEDRENLTYKFFKDGMRFIIFRHGIPLEEVLRFVLLAMENYSERALFHEDMITRFWKEDFQFIDDVVVDGFGFGDLSEEEVEVEVEKIIGYLRKQLAARSDDITRFARLSAADLELELADVEQVRGGIVSGRPAQEDDKARLQEELLHEQRTRLFAKMVLILFQVIELQAEPGDEEMLLEAVTQVLDLLLVSEDVKGAVALLQRFEKIQGRQMPRERKRMVTSMRDEFRRLMNEPHRLAAVGQYLALSKTLDERAVRAYLSACGEDELIPLVEMLQGMERAVARTLLIEVLAVIGRNHVEIFARRLEHNSSSVVKDMLAIIHAINPPGKIDIVARCLDHPNIMIRLEGLKTLAKSDEPESLKYIERALSDEDIQMRLGALRALALRSPERSAPLFIKQMQAGDFMQRESRERITIATALGETKSPAALTYLSGVFTQKSSIFGRGKVNEMKILAVTGLAAMRSLEAFHVLAQEVQNRNHSMEVLQACRKAALRLKEILEKERV
ncbi:MAG: HEAT repeat domain-containing protein [Myxococcota bacterium]